MSILQDIGTKQSTQRDIALAYAMALQSKAHDDPDWKVINQAIITRWSMSGLLRIKKRAWNIAGKIRP